MSGRLIVIVAAIVGALIALGIVGARVLEHDRRELYNRFADDRRRAVEEAGRKFETSISQIGEDLELASSLLGDADRPELAERELDAIATIKREYYVMEARGPGGGITREIAYNSPEGAAELAEPALDRLLDQASGTPRQVHSSAAGERGVVPVWYRVFSLRPALDKPPVAVLVDLSMLLAGLDLQRNPSSRVVVMSPDGFVAPVSDPKLVDVIARERWSPDPARTQLIDGDVAAELGLPRTTAVMTTSALHVEGDRDWKIVDATSTSVLASQEGLLVRRVFVGAALVLALLLSAGGYVIHNARRAAMLRERLRSAGHLAHLTEKAEKILDHIPSGVLAVASDGHITGANRRFIARFEDVTGRRLGAAFPGAPAEDVTSLTELFEHAMATRTTHSIHRAPFRVLGEESTFNIHVVPLEQVVRDVSALVVFEDVSGMRRFEERIVRSEKLVTAGQLAAGIAHEVGTPLNIARGRLELVMSHLGKDHAEARNHQIVIDQIDRVTRLIQQLLDYMRPAPAALQTVDLRRVLLGVGELLTPQAGKRDVSIAVEIAGELAELRADPDQVQQVVVNLVLNAIDACGEGGHIQLHAKQQGSHAVIEVIDDGHGIPPESQAQVFDPFFTTKKRGQGTGLGLWVVAQLVRASSGEIELHSAPGSGTTVRVTWPVPS